jgi:aspartokinase/homoserine dehydrogenase 1
VVTGFIASTTNGVTTTLGRNGSDYTASILGAALGAKSIEIWTDVDGVLSADPRCVDSAFVINELSIEEAMELSFFGAEVIHPYTMIPAVEDRIPIWIKNTMNPRVPGTIIAKNVKRHEHPITGIASIENCSLINVEGGGMLGVPGVASRVFRALAGEEINIIMISQASSEHSICIVCRNPEADRAAKALEAELAWELEERTINQIEVLRDLEIIAIIGENMRGTPGISGRLFSSLGDAKVNVLAIAQGSSERNISFVIHGQDKKRALNAIHSAFLEQEQSG